MVDTFGKPRAKAEACRVGAPSRPPLLLKRRIHSLTVKIHSSRERARTIHSSAIPPRLNSPPPDQPVQGRLRRRVVCGARHQQGNPPPGGQPVTRSPVGLCRQAARSQTRTSQKRAPPAPVSASQSDCRSGPARQRPSWYPHTLPHPAAIAPRQHPAQSPTKRPPRRADLLPVLDSLPAPRPVLGTHSEAVKGSPPSRHQEHHACLRLSAPLLRSDRGSR